MPATLLVVNSPLRSGASVEWSGEFVARRSLAVVVLESGLAVQAVQQPSMTLVDKINVRLIYRTVQFEII